MTGPSLSIVILNYDTCTLLVRCLQSIQTHAPASEVIVVDNASSDGSAELIQHDFPNVQLVANATNQGFARGMNIGMRRATRSHILALNADIELLPLSIPPLLETLAMYSHAGIVGPAQFRPGVSRQAIASAYPDPTLGREALRLLCFGDAFAARLNLGAWKTPTGSPRAVNWLMGAALLFRQECWNDLGGFDETNFMYGEDWDICYRARQAGWEVYWVPKAQAIHHENAAGAQQFGFKRQARVLQANLHFHEKHYGLASRRCLAALHVVGSGLRMALFLLMRVAKPKEPSLVARWRSQIELARVAWHGCLE